MALVSFASVFSAPLFAQTGPVGNWKLDDGSGTSVSDSSGGSHTGTFVNSPTWTSSGRVNGALTFGGTTAAVTVPGGGNLADVYASGMTFSAWIKPTSAGGGSKGRIADKANWLLYMGGTTTVVFTANPWNTTSAQRTSAASSITLNTWQHVVATWDGFQDASQIFPNGIHLFINGVQSDGASLNGAGTVVSDATLPLTIGNLQPGLNRGFAGSIDEVRVWNRVLTLSEIQALADSTVPSQPGTPTATPFSSAQINLSWPVSTDNVAVTGYRVERCPGASCTTFAQIATPTTNSFSDTGLTASTTYRYRVRATDANANLSNYSGIGSGQTNAAGGDTQAPTAPTGLSVSAVFNTQVNLSWTAATDNVAVTGYVVERCTGTSCTSFASVGTPTGTTFNDTGLASATTYVYRVQAHDAVPLSGPYSTTLTVTTSGVDTTPPNPPTSLTATATSASGVQLTWSGATDNVGVTGYLVERCQGASCSTFTQVAALGAISTYDDSGLTGGTVYLYRVRARDAANVAGATYSPIATATTTTGSGTAGSTTYQYDSFGRLKQITVTPQ